MGTGRSSDPPQWPHPRGSILGRPCPSQLALPASPVQGPQASHTAHAPATVGGGRTGVDRGAQRDAGCAGESGAAEQGAPVQQPVGQCLGTPQLPLLSRETSPRWGPGQRSSDAFLGKGSGPRKRAGQRDSWTGRPLVAADRSQVRRLPGGKPVFGRHRRGRNPSRRSTEQRATGPPARSWDKRHSRSLTSSLGRERCFSGSHLRQEKGRAWGGLPESPLEAPGLTSEGAVLPEP